ncbi:MAG: single-stranded DNA-binding protein [Elusimicrobiota bacterium]
MASFSKVILMGNVTRDPEIRMLPSGTPLAGFGVGINRRFKGSDGNMKEETCFVDITFFGKSAEICEKYVHKGDSIVVEGRLKQDTWEKDGQKKSKIVVIGEKLHLMPKKAGKVDEGDIDASCNESSNDSGLTSKLSEDKEEEKVPF